MNRNCETCIVMDYRISRMVNDIQIDPSIKRYHRERLVFITGKNLVKYPAVDEEICKRECGVIYNGREPKQEGEITFDIA